jgi:nitrile hydratase subunit alpha
VSEHLFTEAEAALRVRAIESLLLEKGLLADGLIDRLVSVYENDIGPMNGARVVARAWVDPEYRERLLADGSRAIDELGLLGLGGQHLAVVENTPALHNVVVCTLCSCYPWAVLGLPPQWYKSNEYRSRLVMEPRVVLSEFGLELDESIEIRVWDSSSDMRYMVLPERPARTEDLDEDGLAALVTREAMIGVARVVP